MTWKENFWKAWFGVHAGREAGKPHRTFLEDADALNPYIKERDVKREPCFLSVQPYRARDQVYGLDKLFFDFDSKEDPPSLDKAWNETCHFVNTLKRFYNAQSLIVFSGRRGFPIYIWLWQVIEFQPSQETLAKAIYKALQNKLLRGLHYETLDPEVLGDIKRLARLPYTIHEKSGLLCKPVTENRQPLWVLPSALEEYPKRGIQEPFFRRVIEAVKIEQKIEEARKKRQTALVVAQTRSKHATTSYSPNRIRPCISEALQTSLDGEYGHLMRLAIAVEYLNKGHTVDEVVALFQTQKDFDERKTKDMVEHAKKRLYKPRKRETLRKYGFCHGQRCSECVKSGRIAP